MMIWSFFVRAGTAPAAVGSLRDSLPSVHAVLARLDKTAQDTVWRDITQALRTLEGTEGLHAPGEMLLGVGTA